MTSHVPNNKKRTASQLSTGDERKSSATRAHLRNLPLDQQDEALRPSREGEERQPKRQMLDLASTAKPSTTKTVDDGEEKKVASSARGTSSSASSSSGGFWVRFGSTIERLEGDPLDWGMMSTGQTARDGEPIYEFDPDHDDGAYVPDEESEDDEADDESGDDAPSESKSEEVDWARFLFSNDTSKPSSYRNRAPSGSEKWQSQSFGALYNGTKRKNGSVDVRLETFVDKREKDPKSRRRTAEVSAIVEPTSTKGREKPPESESGFRAATSNKLQGGKNQASGHAYRNQGRTDVQKGHVLALQLGGPDDRRNIVPQWANWQANGTWKRMENSLLAQAMKLATKKSRLEVRIQPIYKGDASSSSASFDALTVPSAFIVTAWEIDAGRNTVRGGYSMSAWLDAHQDGTDDMVMMRADDKLSRALGESSEFTPQDLGKDKAAKRKAKKERESKGEVDDRDEWDFDTVTIDGLGSFRQIPMSGDGNHCMYRMAIYALGLSATPQQIRTQVADHQTKLKLSKEHIAGVRGNARGTTREDLQAIADLHGATFIVYAFNLDRSQVLQRDVIGSGSQVIHVAHVWGGHYEPLEPSKKSS